MYKIKYLLCFVGVQLPELAVISRAFAVMVGGILLAAAAPVCAQQAPIVQPAVITPPMIVSPLVAPTPSKVQQPPALQMPADLHVDSTRLGYDKGIGPAVGRLVTWRDKEYEVTDIVVSDGGPSFSGGSRFVVAPAGRGLMVGLRALEGEKLAALAADRKARSLN